MHTLHYITLHYITLHYITLHTSINSSNSHGIAFLSWPDLCAVPWHRTARPVPRWRGSFSRPLVKRSFWSSKESTWSKNASDHRKPGLNIHHQKTWFSLAFFEANYTCIYLFFECLWVIISWWVMGDSWWIVVIIDYWMINECFPCVCIYIYIYMGGLQKWGAPQ